MVRLRGNNYREHRSWYRYSVGERKARQYPRVIYIPRLFGCSSFLRANLDATTSPPLDKGWTRVISLERSCIEFGKKWKRKFESTIGGLTLAHREGGIRKCSFALRNALLSFLPDSLQVIKGIYTGVCRGYWSRDIALCIVCTKRKKERGASSRWRSSKYSFSSVLFDPFKTRVFRVADKLLSLLPFILPPRHEGLFLTS